VLIPLIINEDELLVRCIGNEIFYSTKKQRIASTAFLPPRESNEVSLLRLSYTDAHRCKAHAKSLKIGDYIYCGLSITKAKSFLEATVLIGPTKPTYKNATEIELNVVATPLDIDENKREEEEIYVTDDGLPSHADLLYNFTPEEGKTAPNALKKVAKYLSKNPPTIFFKDEDIESQNWEGPALEFNPPIIT